MKFTPSFLTLAFASILFISCKQTASEPTTTTSVETTVTKKENVAAKVETASFQIEGMTCAMGCAKTIEKKLAEMDGVQKATVDFDKKTATVEFDANKQTPEKLVETVEATADGKTYKVSNVTSSGNHASFIIPEHQDDQEKEKKESKKKGKKSDAKATNEAKPSGCCAKKKSCSSGEKKACSM